MTDTATVYKSPLHQMTQTTCTCLWNDSSSLAELGYAIDNGAFGATCNPVIVVEVLKKEMHLWKDRILELIRSMPQATEHDVAWKLVDEMSIKGAELLKPIFDAHNGKNGRLSVQTDPRFYRDTDAIVRQAEHFAALAPNIIVKIPVTAAGIPAIEEATYSRNQHQCHRLLLPASVRGGGRSLRARPAAAREGGQGHQHHGIGLHDHGGPPRRLAEGPTPTSTTSAWTLASSNGRGVAVFKKTYRLFQERGYRIRLLSAAFRNHMHWSELIGGDVVISPPHLWQKRFNACDVPVESRIDTPVAPAIVKTLEKFPDFRRASTEGGLKREEFDTFPPTRRTLRQFITACHDLDGQIRELMLPNPDIGG